jgi:serine/threonine-protein kinase RsbW
MASSLHEIRAAVRGYADAAGAAPDVVAAAALAVNEAATNAIVHGYDGGSPDQTIHVGAERNGTWVRFVVADRGSGLRPRRNSPGVGLGLAMIAQCADELELHENPDNGLELRMAFRLTR